MKPPPGPELRNTVLTLEPAKAGLAPTQALQQLVSGNDALSPIFAAGNDLLTQPCLAVP